MVRLNSVGAEKPFSGVGCGGGGAAWGGGVTPPYQSRNPLTTQPKRLSACRLPARFDRSLKRHHADWRHVTREKERRPGNWATAVKESLALRPQPRSLPLVPLPPQCQHGANNIFPAASCLALLRLLLLLLLAARLGFLKQSSGQLSLLPLNVPPPIFNDTWQRESQCSSQRLGDVCTNNAGLVRLVSPPDDCDVTPIAPPPLQIHTPSPTVGRYPQTLTSLIT